MWHLVINGPGHRDARHVVKPGLSKVGRADDNDLILPGDAVSRHHARLRCSDTGLAWEDLGSRNGTVLNGVRASGTSLLGAGDVLFVGETTLRVEHVTPGQLPSEPPAAGSQPIHGVQRLDHAGSDLNLGAALLAQRSVGPRAARSTGSEPALDRERARSTTGSGKSSAHRPRETPPAAGKPRGAPQAPPFFVRVAQAALEATDAEPFATEVCDLAVAHLGATSAALLLQDTSGALVPAASSKDAQSEGDVPVSDPIVASAARDGRALAVAYPIDDGTAGSGAASSDPRQGPHVVCVPTGDQPPTGVLYLNRSGTSGPPVEACLDAATLGMQLVGPAVRHLGGSPQRTERQLALALSRIYGALASTSPRLKAVVAARVAPPLEAVEGTVLWVELADFWRCAEQMPSAAVTSACALLRRTFRHHVFAQGGAIARAEGEHGLAFFESSGPQSDAPIRAVRCALALRTGWELELARVRADPTVPLRLRMALDSGSVRAGPFGEGGDVAFALFGEPVLVASRLCATAANDEILLTDRTLAITGARFDVLPLGQRALAELSMSAFAFSVTEEDLDANTLPGVR